MIQQMNGSADELLIGSLVGTIPNALRVDEETLFAIMLTKIRPIAVRFSQIYPSYDADDYLSIGMEAMLTAFRQFGKYDLGYLRRAAMRGMITHISHRKTKETPSLEKWMCGGEEDGAMYREMADQIPAALSLSPEKRQLVLTLLHMLPVKYQMVLLSWYGIEDQYGGVWTRESVQDWFGLSHEQYGQEKVSAVRMLRRRAAHVQAM
jgi:DNA-directed RNA polymerase specialized sigma subunit